MAIQTKYQIIGDVSNFQRAMARVKAEASSAGRVASQSFGSLNGSVLKCTGSFGNLTGMLLKGGGVAGAVMAVTAAIGSAFNTIKDFEKANSTLAGILGTTTNNIKALTDQAKLLGSTTAFSATQVTQLQTELAKLGFNQTEIQQSTSAVLKLSSATGSDLGEAAALAGATLRAFNMDASEMSRVTSVLAVSTTKSALDFGKLQTGMATVAPVAKAFGFSIEDTVAMLGKLSDAGFDASSAATATRNILLNLANSNGKLAKALGRPVTNAKELSGALVELRNKGVDLNEALAMTDKRSVAAFETFLTQAEGVGRLSEALTDCNGELDQMVDTMTDNVEGSLNNLSSAWEGLMLAFSDSKGVFRDIIDFLTSMVSAITKIIEGYDGAMARLETMGKANYDKSKAERKADMQKRLQLQVESILQSNPNATREEVEKYVYETERANLTKKAKEDAEVLRRTEQLLNEVETVYEDEGAHAVAEKTNFDWKAARAQFGSLQSNSGLVTRQIDQWKKDVANQRVSSYSSQGDLAIFNDIVAQKTKKEKPTVEDVVGFDDTTIAGLEKHIKALRAEWKGTSDGAKRTSLYMEIQDLEKKLDELKGKTSKTKKAVKDIGKEGSLSFAKNELENAQKQYEMATTATDREAAKSLINKWQSYISEIERTPIEIDVVARGQKSAGILNATPKDKDEFGTPKELEEQYSEYKQYINSLSAEIDKLGDDITEALASGVDTETLQPLIDQYYALSDAMQDATGKSEELKASIMQQREAKAAIEEAQNSFSAMSSVMGSAAELAEGDAQKVIQGMSDIMSAIAQLIPLLMSRSMAEGTAKVTETSSSWYEIIPGIAAVVATIASTFSSLKYATGGVVGGSAFNADRIPAMVQSGEMILNKRQQRNLFALLDGGGVASGGSSSSTMRITGRDLVATINTQNKLTSKLK